jgi:hypothetical protein
MLIRITLIFLLLSAFVGVTACTRREPPTDWKGIADYMRESNA